MDHKAEALKLLLSQYKNSPNLIGYINSFLDISQDVEDLFQTLLLKFDLDTATGSFLDDIGCLMGVPRFPVELDAQYFQLNVTPWSAALPFPTSAIVKFELLDDERYRCVLKSWRIVLNSIGTVDDVIKSLAALFCIPTSDVEVNTSVIVPFQLNVTPLNGPAVWIINPLVNVEVFVNKALDIGELYLYNYKAPNGSNLWAKVAGYSYMLTHL